MHRHGINFKHQGAHGWLLFLLVALSLSQVAPVLAAEPVALPAPKLLTRAELKSAVEKGEKIVDREIQGEDIIAVLTPWITPDSKCMPNVGLHIEKGVIRGDVRLEFKTPPAKPGNQTTRDSDDDDTEDTATDDSRHKLANWLTVPLLITESTVNDHLQIDSLGFACAVDLSGSTFESGTRSRLERMCRPLARCSRLARRSRTPNSDRTPASGAQGLWETLNSFGLRRPRPSTETPIFEKPSLVATRAS
jgi:hypothetical protein